MILFHGDNRILYHGDNRILCHGDNRIHVDESMKFALLWTSMSGCIFIELAH
jgi:hypothetical protein